MAKGDHITNDQFIFDGLLARIPEIRKHFENFSLDEVDNRWELSGMRPRKDQDPEIIIQFGPEVGEILRRDGGLMMAKILRNQARNALDKGAFQSASDALNELTELIQDFGFKENEIYGTE